MREIKFRAWDNETKSMIVNSTRKMTLQNGFDYGNPMFELMQYTGLKDKNGKEIYEGDILSFSIFDYNDNDVQYKGVIVYSGSRFSIWNNKDSEYYGSDGGFDLDYTVSQDDELEIIGNIYENKNIIE